jgi:hypothetical protein
MFLVAAVVVGVTPLGEVSLGGRVTVAAHGRSIRPPHRPGVRSR